MYKFSNPKLALRIIDEIIIPGRFPNYINLDSDEYDEHEVDKVLDEVLDSPLVKVDETNSEETIAFVSQGVVKLEAKNDKVILSAKVIDWDTYNELKESVK